MPDWPLICLGGILGSAHCMGMCGGFALSVGIGSRSPADNVVRQMLYSAGRLCTYGFGGATLGYVGLSLMRAAGPWTIAQGALSLSAGLFLAYLGLASLGLIPRFVRWRRSAQRGCQAASLFASYLRSPGWTPPFLAGVLTGFLPCGLVYAFLALAASGGSVWRGTAVMLLFGLGTVPAMVLTGAGASLLGIAFRRRLLRVAAVCVLATGLLSIARGAAAVQAARRGAAGAKCPFCQSQSAGEATERLDPAPVSAARRADQ